MGTQFSKIKVTSRVEVHGQVYSQYRPGLDTGYTLKSNSTNDLSEDIFTRRAHHRWGLSQDLYCFPFKNSIFSLYIVKCTFCHFCGVKMHFYVQFLIICVELIVSGYMISWSALWSVDVEMEEKVACFITFSENIFWIFQTILRQIFNFQQTLYEKLHFNHRPPLWFHGSGPL